MNRKTAHRILLICPVGLLALSVITTNLQGPFYLGHNLDPEYAYLLNALNVATLQVPGLYGHPGTTLQVIGAVIMLTKWVVGCCLFGPWESLQDAVLLHPEDYLHAFGLVLNLLLSGMIYIGARQIYRLSESLVAALVFQISFAAFMQTFLAQARVSPEPLLASAVVLLAVPVARIVLSPDDTISTPQWLPIATGAALGFGIVTKANFLPLFTVGLLFRTKRALVACGLSCIATALVCSFPIWTHFPDMFPWFTSLLTHTERYGQGPVGVPSVTTLWAHVGEMFRYEPMIFFFLAFYLVVWAAVRIGWVRCDSPVGARISRLLLVGSVAIIIQVAITVKHFAMHYMLPALVFTMLLNASVIVLLSRARPNHTVRVLYAGTVLLLAIGVWHTAPRLIAWTKMSQQYRADVESLSRRRSEMKDCTTVGFYRSSSPEFALAFGNDFAGSAYRRELARIYPNAIHYSIWGHQFYSMAMQPKRTEVRRAVAAGGCVLMFGGPLSKEDQDSVHGFTLEPIVVAGTEGLYRLAVMSSAELIADPALPANAISIDAREFSSGNVVIDNSAYGVGIGVIISPTYPAYAEYKVAVQSSGRYELRIRCAAADPRPLNVVLDGKQVTNQGCSESTDGYDPGHQFWQIAGAYDLASGTHTLRLQSEGPFPVISRLGLVPVKR